MKKNNLSDSIKKIKRLFTKKADRSYCQNAEHDWLVILMCSCVMCVGVLAVDGYIFYKLNRGELFNSAPILALKVPALNRPLLEQEINFYQQNPSTAMLPSAEQTTATTTAATSTAN